jgi:hypothetical protein
MLNEELMETLESVQNSILAEIGEKCEYQYVPVSMACPTYCDSLYECSM